MSRFSYFVSVSPAAAAQDYYTAIATLAISLQLLIFEVQDYKSGKLDY